MRLVCLFGCWLAASASLASAQTSATIAGRVADASGAFVPGVTVSVRQASRGIERSAVTDAGGRYLLAGLPAGVYDIRADLSGFKSVEREGVTLAVGASLSLDFVVEVGGVTEVVHIVEEVPSVNTRSGELSYLVDDRAI